MLEAIREFYESPELDVVEFDAEDVIATSEFTDDEDWGGGEF